MFKIFHRNEMIQFSGRKHSAIGIVSAIIGGLVILGFIATSILSSIHNGQGGEFIGMLGLLLLVLAVLGFILSYKSLKQRDIYYRFPLMGISFNGFMIILLVVIYLIGFA